MSTGRKLLNLAKRHVGEPYIFGAFAPKDNADWTGPWDCAEFISWCAFQVGGRLYGCHDRDAHPAEADAYTGYWARDAQELGTIISVEDAARTPGAALLRAPKRERIGHVVISDGHGGTMEAHSRTRGVIEHTLNGRRWDMGLILPGIRYSINNETIDVSPASVIYRYKTPMMGGGTVKKIQQALAEKSFDPGIVDGFYGSQTEAAVMAFQLSKGLMVDGEVGPQTAEALGVELS
jgi:murein L,D-transpeptidase YcbB/YkuD